MRGSLWGKKGWETTGALLMDEVEGFVGLPGGEVITVRVYGVANLWECGDLRMVPPWGFELYDAAADAFHHACEFVFPELPAELPAEMERYEPTGPKALMNLISLGRCQGYSLKNLAVAMVPSCRGEKEEEEAEGCDVAVYVGLNPGT